MANFHSLFGFIAVSAQAAPYVVVGLYAIAGAFLTMAWFFHLKFPVGWPWWAFIAISWGIFALCEYVFANQATRLGVLGGYYSINQLKTIQTVMGIIAYVLIAYFVLNERITLMHLGGFALMGIGVLMIFSAPK